MLPWWELAVRPVLATLLGGLIGWEREERGKPAGLRTLALVSLAACVFVLASEQAAIASGVPPEPARAMTGVAQGVGFLGAGAILQSKGEIRWLTTAAALWSVAAVGFACAEGMYALAVIGGGLVFVLLRWVAIVEDRWFRRREQDPKRKIRRP